MAWSFNQIIFISYSNFKKLIGVLGPNCIQQNAWLLIAHVFSMFNLTIFCDLSIKKAII